MWTKKVVEKKVFAFAPLGLRLRGLKKTIFQEGSGGALARVWCAHVCVSECWALWWVVHVFLCAWPRAARCAKKVGGIKNRQKKCSAVLVCVLLSTKKGIDAKSKTKGRGLERGD